MSIKKPLLGLNRGRLIHSFFHAIRFESKIVSLTRITQLAAVLASFTVLLEPKPPPIVYRLGVFQQEVETSYARMLHLVKQENLQQRTPCLLEISC